MVSSDTSLTEQGSLYRCVVCGAQKPKHEFQPNQLGNAKRKPRCKDCLREYQLLHKFGITKAEYRTLLQAQDGRCKICGRTDAGTNAKGQFCVDDNHTTGEVRGLLCNWCNMGLGAFFDSPTLLRRAIAYLESTGP
jgi:ribosomal protein S14